MHDYPILKTGLVRLSEIFASKDPIPVVKSTCWEGVKNDRFTRSFKLEPSTTISRVEKIHALFEDQTHG